MVSMGIPRGHDADVSFTSLFVGVFPVMHGSTSRRSFLKAVTIGAAALSLFGSAQAAHQDPSVIWSTAAALAPGWGFWVAPGKRGGTLPLGECARYKTPVVGSGTLTWIAEFPRSGSYQVWVRHCGNRATVLVDERPVTGGTGGPNAHNQYTWWHLGEKAIQKGSAHVDIVADRTMLDAVLFTLNKDWRPEVGPLPEAVKNPVVRAPRKYREDAHLKDAARATGLVAGRINDPYQEHFNDMVPAREEVLKILRIWGSPNQYVTGTFCLRALERADEVKISLDSLAGPNWELDRQHLDLKIAHLRERSIALYCEQTTFSNKGFIPDLLLRDDRTGMPPTGKQGGFGSGGCVTSMPAHESRQIWLTAQLPAECPPGELRGNIDILVKGSPERKLSIPVALEVLPIDLQPVEGYYGSYYRADIDPNRTAAINPERFLSELRFQVRYGLNAVTLYGGFPMLPYAREAGMTRPPVMMQQPWGDDQVKQVAKAKAMGFPDLYYYGIDEPTTEEQIKAARVVGERSSQLGIHLQMAVYSPAAYQKLRDYISRPVLQTYNFDLTHHNDAIQYARQKRLPADIVLVHQHLLSVTPQGSGWPL